MPQLLRCSIKALYGRDAVSMISECREELGGVGSAGREGGGHFQRKLTKYGRWRAEILRKILTEQI